jgi:hypothetical protein
MSNYKLTDEIKEFIINNKKSNSMLSCRKLSPLIEENFKIKLSKSLINNVLKEANLSSSVGRKRLRRSSEESLDVVEVKEVRNEEALENTETAMNVICNGGAFFLKIADIKLSLTSVLSETISTLFHNIAGDKIEKMNEILIYMKLLKIPIDEQWNYKKMGIWWLQNEWISEDDLKQYYQALHQMPITEANKILNKLGITHNINKINDLYKQCLLKLHSYSQMNFFPPEYQFLDVFAMKERFYSLPAKIEKSDSLLKVQLFYPKGFFWINDPIWQEGFSFAVKKVNESKAFTKNGEHIWINPAINLL